MQNLQVDKLMAHWGMYLDIRLQGIKLGGRFLLMMVFCRGLWPMQTMMHHLSGTTLS
jgi:hypothetical protein